MSDQNLHGQPAPIVNIYAVPAAGNGLATASLVLGILAMLTVWIPFFGMIAWILAPMGLVFGLVGLGKPNGRSVAIAGTVCSALGLIGCFAWVALIGITTSVS